MNLEKFRKIADQISRHVPYLRELADAFRTTGQECLASNLEAVANNLATTRDQLNDLVHEEVDRQFQEARQSSANVLNSMLVGIQLGKDQVSDE